MFDVNCYIFDFGWNVFARKTFGRQKIILNTKGGDTCTIPPCTISTSCSSIPSSCTIPSTCTISTVKKNAHADNKNKNKMPYRSYATISKAAETMPPFSAVSSSISAASTFVPVSTGPSRVPSSSLMRDGPKPVKQAKIVLGEWEALIPGILNDAGNFSNTQILDNLKKAASIMQRNSGIDHWLSDEGQSELLRMIHADAKPPASTPQPWEINGGGLLESLAP